MLSMEQFAIRLTRDPPPGSHVRSCLTLPPTAPPFGPACSTYLPDWLASMQCSQGIERLAKYQWHALRLLQQQHHVCVSAPSGSGRNVIRLLALFQSLNTEPRGHALCIFLHKRRELAQLKTITACNDHLRPEHRLVAEIYDGDTPKTQRRAIKRSLPDVLLTTPEMLHAGILAYHGGWRAFFQSLRLIVLVDLHQCTSAIGIHLAHLWRRLYRLCRHYGSHPQYLITTAPLGNLRQATHSLTGQPCTVIHGEAWQRQSQTRMILEVSGNAVMITHKIATKLSEAGMAPRILAFDTDVRPQAESDIPRRNPLSDHDVRSVIFLGVPTSLTRLHETLAWLASRPTPSASILILHGQTPLERYLLRYPAVYQTAWLQDLPLHLSHPLIARQHLLCAASELALEAGERYAGLDGLSDLINQLAADNTIVRHPTARRWITTQHQPHRRVRLRSYEPAFAVVHQHDRRLITTLEPDRAFRELFEGAIFHHASDWFHVQRYLADQRRILVRPTHDTHHRTRGLVKTWVTDRHIEASQSTATYRVTYGTLTYTATMHAFEHRDARTLTRTSLHILPNHQRQFHTQGVWIDFPDAAAVPHQDLQTAVHTLIHAVLAGIPLMVLGEGMPLRGVICDQNDPGAAGLTAVFVDPHTGGSGLSRCFYRAQERVLRVALQLLLQCECDRGCGDCIAEQSCDACETAVGVDRQAGINLLQRMLGEVAPTLEAIRPQVESAQIANHHG